MAEEFLDQTSVHPLISQEVARRMAQHVRVGIDIEAGFLPSFADDVGQGVSGQGAPRSVTKPMGCRCPFAVPAGLAPRPDPAYEGCPSSS